MSERIPPVQNEYRVELEALRAEFDLAFASAPVLPVEDAQDYVLVSGGGRGYALLAGSLAGIETGVGIVPIPSSVAALAGITGVHGAVVPVFDLGAALGQQSSAADDEDGLHSVALLDVHAQRGGSRQARHGARVAARLGQEEQQIGLAFSALERFIRMSAQTLYTSSDPDQPSTLLDGGQLYLVVDLPALALKLTHASALPHPYLPAAAASAEDSR